MTYYGIAIETRTPLRYGILIVTKEPGKQHEQRFTGERYSTERAAWKSMVAKNEALFSKRLHQ